MYAKLFLAWFQLNYQFQDADYFISDETDKCCVTVPSENPELEPEYSECVQDPLQMGVKCALRGCGAEWYCSEDAKSRGASCDCSIWRGNSCPIGRRWRKCIRLCGSC